MNGQNGLTVLGVLALAAAAAASPASAAEAEGPTCIAQILSVVAPAEPGGVGASLREEAKLGAEFGQGVVGFAHKRETCF